MSGIDTTKYPFKPTKISANDIDAYLKLKKFKLKNYPRHTFNHYTQVERIAMDLIIKNHSNTIIFLC